jgi:hypothetical protein
MHVYDPEPELEPEPEPEPEPYSNKMSEPEPSSNFPVPQPWWEVYDFWSEMYCLLILEFTFDFVLILGFQGFPQIRRANFPNSGTSAEKPSSK